MDFFDPLIKDVEALCEHQGKSVYEFSETNMWKESAFSQVILKRDTAFELDGTGFCLVTSKPLPFETVVVGKNLKDITASSKFARIAVVSVDFGGKSGDEYNLIKRLEYVKYHFFPEGYMLRSSSSSFKEGVRVGKGALKEGMSFEKIGNLMINKLKAVKGVRGARIYFFTSESTDYEKLSQIAQKNREITEALNHVMNSVNFDCSTCALKPVCDEVDGMREMHFKTISN